jgi:two-component system OmpR family response regulator
MVTRYFAVSAMDILIVEDDPKTALYVTEGLQEHGHVIHWASTGPDGLAQAHRGIHSLLIVDRMLPSLDGLSLVKRLRDEGFASPVLFLTTMSDLNARVEGLNAGADDYLTKPFAISELVARINAVSRRASHGAAVPARLRVGRLEINPLNRTASREGKPIDLQLQEFRLLEYLMQNAGRIVTRGMLLEHVWDLNFDPRSNIVEAHISRLRAKIDRGFSTGMIQTVRGEGYVVRPD